MTEDFKGMEKRLRREAVDAARRYYEAVHKKTDPFKPGNRIPYAGRVFDDREISLLVESSLDFWLTTGRFADTLEKGLAKFLNVAHCSLVNSGSSANLLAFMALTSPMLGEKAIRRGDEVITVAAGFPTTVAPIIQYGAVPVFIDVTIPYYNADTDLLESALTKKTKAVMLAHTLGNPFDLSAVKAFCDRRGLWLIEDNCDALGSRYLYNGRWRHTGTIGNIGTSSFYPPHHMTTGEGGAVYTDDPALSRIMESFRDWGRDCWCASGKDNTCNKRFDQRHGELPFGYDHKYVYSHFGYNLKGTDMQAAIGCAQLEKLPSFIEARKRNWQYLRDDLLGLEDCFIMPAPVPGSEPSWFGFALTLCDDAPFTRSDIVGYLEANGIQTRMLFAGNIIKHPCFDDMRRDKTGFRVVGNIMRERELKNTDMIMNRTFWFGVYPGLTEEMLSHIAGTIKGFVHARGRR